MPKLAYKRQYDFGHTERYRIFIKNNLLTLNPAYYSIVAAKKVLTVDGEMYGVKIVREIQNPNLEMIAECYINGEYVYLWNDYCWAVAVNKDKHSIAKVIVDDKEDMCTFGSLGNAHWSATFNRPTGVGTKVLLLYRIGTSKVEEIVNAGA